MTLRSTTRARPLEGSLLDAAPELARAFVWTRAGDGFVAWGEAARLDAGTGPERFARASAALGELFSRAGIDDAVARPGTGPLALVSFTFDDTSAGSRVVVPSNVVWSQEGVSWSTRVQPSSDGRTPDDPSFGELAPHDEHAFSGAVEPPDERAFSRAVAHARAEIRAGWLAKVVLARAQTVRARQPFDVAHTLRALAATFPQCYTFSFDGLVGASPELLVRRVGSTVESLVLAGSARRGATAEEDAALGAGLLASPKERSEHEFAVASARDVLELVCADLKSDAEPWLLRLANVQHLATALRGELAEPVDVLTLAAKLHPTASVCGVPSGDALAIIRASEGFDRARYTGPIGWIDARGDGEIAIALRCAEIAGTNARLFAGAGIVADSDPDAELFETKLKLRAMRDALGLAE